LARLIDLCFWLPRAPNRGQVSLEEGRHEGCLTLPVEKHGLRFHDLRHTAASLAILTGGHPLLVSMLGHGSVEMTLNRLMPNVAKALAEKLDAIYRAAPPRVDLVPRLGNG
jgi:integrase